MTAPASRLPRRTLFTVVIPDTLVSHVLRRFRQSETEMDSTKQVDAGTYFLCAARINFTISRNVVRVMRCICHWPEAHVFPVAVCIEHDEAHVIFITWRSTAGQTLVGIDRVIID